MWLNSDASQSLHTIPLSGKERRGEMWIVCPAVIHQLNIWRLGHDAALLVPFCFETDEEDDKVGKPPQFQTVPLSKEQVISAVQSIQVWVKNRVGQARIQALLQKISNVQESESHAKDRKRGGGPRCHRTSHRARFSSGARGSK